MSDNKEVYRRLIAEISSGNAAGLSEVVAADMIDHNPVEGQAPGLEGVLHWMSFIRAAVPDLRGTVEDVIAEGDKVVGRVTWNGTQKGEFLGLAPTGKPIQIKAIHIVRIAGGKVAEWWGVADLLGARQQIEGKAG